MHASLAEIPTVVCQPGYLLPASYVFWPAHNLIIQPWGVHVGTYDACKLYLAQALSSTAADYLSLCEGQ